MQKIKKILKKFFLKKAEEKVVEETVCDQEINENLANEMLERQLMEQQKNYREAQPVVVHSEFGSFTWSSVFNQFVPVVDQDLIEAKFCETSHQLPQIQCC